MNHETIRDMISAYYDGQLSEKDRPAVEAHLGLCPECRLFYERWKTISGRLFRRELPTASEVFVQGVMARLDALETRPVERPAFHLIPVQWFAPVFGLAAMLLLALSPSTGAVLPSAEGLLLGGQADSASQWLATGQAPNNDMLSMVMEES